MRSYVLFFALAGPFLASCGEQLNGIYVSNGKSLFDKKVIITIGGQSNVMTLDDKGCVDGGMVGKFCKKT